MYVRTCARCFYKVGWWGKVGYLEAKYPRRNHETVVKLQTVISYGKRNMYRPPKFERIIAHKSAILTIHFKNLYLLPPPERGTVVSLHQQRGKKPIKKKIKQHNYLPLYYFQPAQSFLMNKALRCLSKILVRRSNTEWHHFPHSVPSHSSPTHLFFLTPSYSRFGGNLFFGTFLFLLHRDNFLYIQLGVLHTVHFLYFGCCTPYFSRSTMPAQNGTLPRILK